MKSKIALQFFVILFLASCSSPMQQIWKRENYKGNEFKKILVIAIAKDAESGTSFENAIVEVLHKNGFESTNSLEVYGSETGDDKLSDAQVEQNIKNGNYDGVLISNLIDVQTKKISITGPAGNTSAVGNYRSYVNSGIQFKYTDENYLEEKSFVLETSMFDISITKADETMVWSGQYAITDPISFYSASKEYADKLVKSLIQSKIIH